MEPQATTDLFTRALESLVAQLKEDRSILALMLCGVGVYGALAMLVHAGARETAVRVALGATPSRVLGRALGLSPFRLPLAINYTDPATGANPTYEKGLGVHALSKITYYVGGACDAFTAEVGLEARFAGNVIFKVDTDGVNRYQSRTFTPGFAPEQVNVDLTGVQYVDLVVEAPGSINGAHGVWGDAKFSCD